MRRFVLEMLAFMVVQAVVAAAVWQACPRREDHYAAATGDKRRRLEDCNSPRLIFVGGSSAAFGFDSRVAAQAGFEPVNMGHNRSLGLRFMLGQVRDGLREGDVVVLSPEYELLWKPGVDSTLVTHLEYDPPSLRALDLETSRRLLDRALPWVSSKVRCALHQVSTAAPIGYTRDAFDDYGDFASHRGTAARPHAFEPARWPSPPEVDLVPAIEVLQSFARDCARAKARCVFAFSPLREGQFEANEVTVQHVARQVRERSGLEVVLDLEDAVHPHVDYYDAGPHVVPAAATARTRALLQGL
ncbi:MAG: hypothetical protein ACE37F_04360 [Nannocystaceae bacterium]|nr:hypothetical protein [bacterium]